MEKPVNILWTSGWDSTYRLLELLLVQKRRVQPYYIKDEKRKSTKIELWTMEKIRDILYKKHPETKEFLLPTIIKEKSQIKPDSCISQQYQRLFELRHLGGQYDWLSRFASQEKINDLELCIDTYTPGFFNSYVRPSLMKEEDGGSFNYKLEEKLSNPDLKLFQYYKFPIHEFSKLDLEKLAIKYKFLDILELSWFCHKPIVNKPCGLCSPCRITIEHGLQRRIGLIGRLRNFVQYQIKPPVKKMIRYKTRAVHTSLSH